jgi:hypothetical protein
MTPVAGTMANNPLLPDAASPDGSFDFTFESDLAGGEDEMIFIDPPVCHPERSEGSPPQTRSFTSFRMTMICSLIVITRLDRVIQGHRHSPLSVAWITRTSRVMTTIGDEHGQT